MDPGQWWVPEEVGCHPQRNDLLCPSCTTRGTQSSGTRQGHFCMRNPKRMDIQEETLGETRVHQWNKGPRFESNWVWGRRGHMAGSTGRLWCWRSWNEGSNPQLGFEKWVTGCFGVGRPPLKWKAKGRAFSWDLRNKILDIVEWVNPLKKKKR
jgi:hypothetical protein